MAEIESLLREAREWMNRAVGKSWAVHDMVNPLLFDRIDAVLAALREQGEAVLPPLPAYGIAMSTGSVVYYGYTAEQMDTHGLACYRAGNIDYQAALEDEVRRRGGACAPAVACDWWQEEEEDSDTYATACGEMFYVSDGSEDIGGWAKFCCYCSKPLAPHRGEAPQDDAP